MNRKLLNLLARNAKKGEFKAEDNTIYLYDVIVATDADADWFGGVSAESFVQTLKGMTGDVDLRINSPGGDVFGGKAMAQAVRDYPGTVTAYVDGVAASAATFLTAVADKTVMAQGSMQMIHKAWTIALGNADDFTATAELLGKIDGTIVEAYQASAAKRGVDPANFADLMAKETWLTAQEAIELGLADEQAQEKPKAKVDWDLSAYENVPAPKSDEITITVNVDTTDASAKIAELAANAVAAAAPVIAEAANKTNEIEAAARRRRRTAARLQTPA